VQQDELALLRSLAKENAAKAKLSKAESEKSKAKTVHYQDPMDVDSEEIIESAKGTLGILTVSQETSPWNFYQDIQEGVPGYSKISNVWGQ
jgi:hypothetical protein